MMEQDRYVRKAFSSHTPEEYDRRLDKIFDLESQIAHLDFQIARLKDGKKTINQFLKQKRTELGWETYMGEPVIRHTYLRPDGTTYTEIGGYVEAQPKL